MMAPPARRSTRLPGGREGRAVHAVARPHRLRPLAHRPDWKVIDNPFGDDDPIVLLPALKPDIALFHAPMADRAGNVWIGSRRELTTMAHAAAKTVVTVERIVDGDCSRARARRRPLPGFYVEAIAVDRAAPGRWRARITRATRHLAEYARLAAKAEGFPRYLRAPRPVRRAA